MSNQIIEKNNLVSENDKIIEEYKIKSLYLAKCAHEIKNILISITSFIENSQIIINANDSCNDNETRDSLTPEKSKNFLKSLCDFGMNLIFDINRLSKEEQVNKLHFINDKIEQFNAIEALNFCAKMFESRCNFEKKNIKIEKSFQIPFNKKITSIGQVKFKQVIINLLSNSYKFTIKGFIKLSAEKLNNKIKITISDSGVGFSKNEMNDINTPFHMLKNNQYLNKNGSGLGLYITKEILNYCGSELKYESEKGVGSKFWFELDDYNIIDPTFILSDNLKQLISEINSGNKDSNPIFTENNINSHVNIDNIHNGNDESIKFCKTFSKKPTIIQFRTNTYLGKKNHHTVYPKLKKKISSSFKQKTSVNKKLLNFKVINDSRSFTVSNEYKRSSDFEQKNFKILICDDDRYTALSTRNSLHKYFKSKSKIFQTPEILICPNGIECLYIVYKNFIMDNSIKVLFIDKNMPFIDGSTTCSIIKNSVELSDIKIYILSSGSVNINECKANGFYQKPLTTKLISDIFVNQNDFKILLKN